MRASAHQSLRNGDDAFEEDAQRRNENWVKGSKSRAKLTAVA
jgi:hypothetical protein